MGRHIDPLDMVDYARGLLDRARSRDVIDHCNACEECGDQLSVVLLLRRAAHESRVAEMPRAKRFWVALPAARRAALVAASLGVVVAAGFLVTRSQPVAAPPGGADVDLASAERALVGFATDDVPEDALRFFFGAVLGGARHCRQRAHR